MNSKILFGLITMSVFVIGGIVCTLIGFRWVGPAPGKDPKYEAWYAKAGKSFKWSGPALIAFGVLYFLSKL